MVSLRAERMVRRALVVFVVVLVAGMAAAQPWTPLGPDGGDVRALAYDPQDPQRIFLGTSAGQLFLSSDAGASWARVAHLGEGDDYVLDHILINPQDGTLYVSAWSVEQPTGDIFRSRDGGRTWQALAAMHGRSVRSLAMAQSDPRVLVAGALDGVFRSNDAGNTWQRISPEGHAEIKNIESLALDPRSPDIVYAGTWHLPWKTSDGGLTWRSIKQGVIDDSDVFSIIVDHSRPSVVYVSACSGIYKSESAGELFRKVQGIPYSARRTRVLHQDPRNPNIVYAGTTEGLWKTADAGQTWRRVSSANLIVNDVLVDPRSPSRLLVATEPRLCAPAGSVAGGGPRGQQRALRRPDQRQGIWRRLRLARRRALVAAAHQRPGPARCLRAAPVADRRAAGGDQCRRLHERARERGVAAAQHRADAGDQDAAGGIAPWGVA